MDIIRQRFPLRSAILHPPGSTFRSATWASSSSSVWVTPTFSFGESLYHQYHTQLQITPGIPNVKNDALHPNRTWIGTTNSGAMAPPNWLVIHTIPQARARCCAGIHRAITAPAFGYAPA